MGSNPTPSASRGEAVLTCVDALTCNDARRGSEGRRGDGVSSRQELAQGVRWSLAVPGDWGSWRGSFRSECPMRALRSDLIQACDGRRAALTVRQSDNAAETSSPLAPELTPRQVRTTGGVQCRGYDVTGTASSSSRTRCCGRCCSTPVRLSTRPSPGACAAAPWTASTRRTGWLIRGDAV